MNKLLPLLFKGSRDYLHGSDFFKVLTELSEEYKEVRNSYVEKLTFRRYASRLCELTDIKPVAQEKIVGQVRYANVIGENIELWLIETNEQVLGSYPFDESIVLEKTYLEQEKRSVRLSKRSIFTPIEDVIILTKHLNYAVSPIVNGRWLFGQLNLNEPLIENYDSLEIQMKKLIEGKFSVNNIFIDGRMIGSIRFIVGEKS